MLLLNPSLSNTSITSFQNNSRSESDEKWFDALDYVEMQDTWFDAYEYYQADPKSSAQDIAESTIPFTDDCRRGIQQFIRTLGEHEESKMLSLCMSKLCPGSSAGLIIAANSLYNAITEGRDIDTATLHALGLASWYLPDGYNIISQVATYLRDTVVNWTDETFLRGYFDNTESGSSSHLFIALAVTAIVAGRWMKDEGGPQRGILKVPAFVANIFIRASHYWSALNHMAQRLHYAGDSQKEVSQPLLTPAFSVDTQIEMMNDVCDSALRYPTSSPKMMTFTSNSTATGSEFIRATVQNRPITRPSVSDLISIPDKAHYLAVDKLRQESGISDLLYCTSSKTETYHKVNEKIINDTYLHTDCSATSNLGPLENKGDDSTLHIGTPDYQISSSHSVGQTLLPLALAASVPVVTSYLQALKSESASAVGVSIGGVGLVGIGKAWLNGAGTPKQPINEAATSTSHTATDIDIQELILKGKPKDVFRNYKLFSDYLGESKKLKPKDALRLGLVRLGSGLYKTNGYLTFSLPPQKKTLAVHQIGVKKKIKRGLSDITFDFRADTGAGKCTLFSLEKNHSEEIFSLSIDGRDIILSDGKKEERKSKFIDEFTKNHSVRITANRGLITFIDVHINGENVYTGMSDQSVNKFFVGIDCNDQSKYYRELSVRALKTESVESHPLLVDWSSFLTTMQKSGIIIDRNINPFNNESMAFYGSDEHLAIINQNKFIFGSAYKSIEKRSALHNDAVLTTALNAVSFVYLGKVLSDPKVDRETKENAILDYVKMTSADVFSFTSGMVEHMDPFKIVSGSFGAGVKGLLKTAGASVGIVFSALNFLEGVEEKDIAKILSATLAALGAVSGVVLSGFTGFGVALFFIEGGLILDAISDAKSRGEQRESFFKNTILNKNRNKLYNYAWISKTNQDGGSVEGYNNFLLKNPNTPDETQVNDGEEKLFYEMLTGSQYVKPNEVGSLNNKTYNTDLENKNKGFIGFKTRETESGQALSHIIYTSSATVKDKSYIGHDNQGKDSIQGYGQFLGGDDTIYSKSMNARINAGEGDDIVFVSGLEDVVDGGLDENIAIIDGLKERKVLSILADGNAKLGDTILKNFGTYILTGTGHEVIINPNELTTTIPIIVCSGGGQMKLINPISENNKAIVLQKNNNIKMPTGNGFDYKPALNSIKLNGKIVAMQKGFSVSIVYN